MATTSYKFPEDLNGRMNAVLSTINTEWKSILWSLMDDSWKTLYDLRTIYESGTGRFLRDSTLGYYNESTLIPIGLVSKKHIRKRGYGYTTVYSLKQEGIDLRPVANFSIKTAADNDMSMYEILSQTNSVNKIRPPMVTYLLLKELSKTKTMRQIDFMKKYHIRQIVFRHAVGRLSKSGLVEYDSVSTENSLGKFVYKWVGGKHPEEVKKDIKVGLSLDTLTSVAKFVMDRNETDSWAITDELGISHNTALHALQTIRKQGFIKNKKFEGGRNQSELTIKKYGIDFFEKFLVPLENSLQSPRMRLVEEILYASEKVDFDLRRKAHDLYEPLSARNHKTSYETKDAIRKVLEKGTARPSMIWKELGYNAQSFLRDMVTDGEVEFVKEKNKSFYKLKR